MNNAKQEPNATRDADVIDSKYKEIEDAIQKAIDTESLDLTHTTNPPRRSASK